MAPGRCCRPLAQLAWAYVLLLLVAPATAGRQLAHQQAELATGSSALDNVVTSEPTTRWQGGASFENSATVIQFDAVLRLTGAHLIPYTTEHQETVIQVFGDTFLRNVGPVELTHFREYYPDPAAPAGIRESNPGVEVHMVCYYLISNVSDNWQDTAYKTFVQAAKALNPGGAWALSLTPVRLVSAMFNRLPCPTSYVLQPLVVLSLTLAVTPTNLGGPLPVEQVSAAAEAIDVAIVGQRLGSLVEVVGRTQLPGTAATLVQVEVTLYKCRSNATVPSPECEQQVLAEVLQLAAVQQQWEEAGLKNTTVVSIQRRQPPPPPSTAPQQQKDWIPWHLDRLDQRMLPLDGSFTANASGSGVNVYVVSSGVRGDHAEFAFKDGTPGTRVQTGWGFQGLNPLQEEPMSGTYYGFGTYAASICCGLKVGVAKNATIHSVRFQEGFLLRPSSWSEGGLPAALDFVLSANTQPAVVLLDTMWVPGRMSRNDSATVAAILSRLDKLQKANLTVIAPALGQDACVNIIGSHPGVISVAATNIYDHAVAYAARNSSCIDMWAPSGGVGRGMVGAEPSGPANYTQVITKGYGAAALVAGLAAQYLQLHPDATGTEVRRALLESASNHTVTGAGVSPTLMAFTNLTQAPVAAPPAAGCGGGAVLSTGATVGIAVGTTVIVAGAAGAAVLILRRGNRRSSGPPASKQGWQVPLADIDIVKRPDGSLHLLGSGRYGSVYKGIKGGVQVVAVREMAPLDNRTRAAFVQNIDMLKSRDANLVQFYGACVRQDRLLLIMEYMEGGDLFGAIASGKGNLQWSRRGKELMLDVVRGLVFLHRSRVVHRDISSKNILLGRTGQAKLSDVGLAQLLKKIPSTPVGALPWAAPESLLGAKVTEKADIYSVGVVLWELVTCEMPQRGQLRAVEVPRECPQAVADAIRDCMQIDPEVRPSAKELFDRLWKCPAGKSSDCGTKKPMVMHWGGSTVKQMDDGGRESGLEKQPSSSTSLQPSTLDRNDSARRSKSGQLNSSWTSSSDGFEQDASGGVVTMDISRIHFCTESDGSRQQLGSGAYGAVYRVLLDGVQPLAAKEIYLGTNTSIHSAFTQEAEMLWRLRHRNIVTLSGVAIYGGRGYMIMELMEGGSLFDQLNLRSKHSRERVFGWYRRGAALVLDIARGLHYIHSMRVSHFDIKSHNILLTRGLHAKIVDVGLSRVLNCTHHSFDCAVGLQGTFPYMAPELLAGTRCTQSVDIFAAGVLIHEICSGEHPVRGRMRPLEVPEECPQGVVDLMRECMHNDPAQRPTARQLVQRLTALAPSNAPTTTPPAQATLAAPKGDVEAAAAATGACATSSGASASSSPAAPQTQPPPKQVPGVEVQLAVTRATFNPLPYLQSSPFEALSQAAVPLPGACQPVDQPIAQRLTPPDAAAPPPAQRVRGAGDQPNALGVPPALGAVPRVRGAHVPAPAWTFTSPFEAMKAIDRPGPC